ARILMDEIVAGRKDLHFIEVMSCPGGCIGGGGQPLQADPAALTSRLSSLYEIDASDGLRVSHKNKEVQDLYKDFLGKPLGEKSHEILHTHYEKRSVMI
ncbi:MAG: iron hydrogenase small subunit, partial [Planctomycetes bacterium]|nr:iron hydrogenase small subunit [Planctomycetota bacterium]